MRNISSLVALTITVIVELIAVYYIQHHTSKRNKLVKAFNLIAICMVFWCIGLILQIFVINCISEKYAFYVDCFVYIFGALLPIALFYFVNLFKNQNFVFKRRYLLLFIIPVVTILVVFTNDLHHLFYEFYSTDISLTKFGMYYYVHTIYTYGLFAYAIVSLVRTSIKSTALASKQTLLIIAGIMVPLIVNAIGALNVISITIYATPVMFSSTVLFWGIAVFKYDFLNITSIALSSIVDQISDAYIVLNTDYEVSSCNNAFEKFFGISKKDVAGKKFSDLKLNEKLVIEVKEKEKIDNDFGNYLEKVQKDNATHVIDAYLIDKSRYFRIEISALISDYKCVGIMFLFKDTTQHIHDMEALKNSQDIMMERERLATLGQMVGGIAHNLKTPIMSIAGAMEGLSDLVTEYDESVEDKEVTPEDHHAIAKDMKEWIRKVNDYDSYMSDVITAVKGQAVNFNDTTSEKFTIDELIKRVNILMKHELKSSLMTLNIDCKIDNMTLLQGNINSLVQVLNNLISNAIQSYGDKQNETIELTFSEENNNIKISVSDHGAGIPQDIQEKLFKSMVTTKGHKGSGLGLFMSYSTIKGHFGGKLNFTSEVGKGTTFNIILPAVKQIN